MTKHTPGPWTASGAGVHTADGLSWVCDCEYDSTRKTSAREEANAALIAAASAMLAALKRLVEIGDRLPMDTQRHYQASYDEARQAIAKAEGK